MFTLFICPLKTTKSRQFLILLSQELRVELDKLLRQKIAQPDMKLSVGTGTGNRESALLRAIIDLITSEENTNWVRDYCDPFRTFLAFFWTPFNFLRNVGFLGESTL